MSFSNMTITKQRPRSLRLKLSKLLSCVEMKNSCIYGSKRITRTGRLTVEVRYAEMTGDRHYSERAHSPCKFSMLLFGQFYKIKLVFKNTDRVVSRSGFQDKLGWIFLIHFNSFEIKNLSENVKSSLKYRTSLSWNPDLLTTEIPCPRIPPDFFPKKIFSKSK